MKQKGIAQIIVIIILVMGLVAGIYLVQKTQIFKPKASSVTTAEFVDSSGNPITETSDRNVKLRIIRGSTNNSSSSALPTVTQPPRPAATLLPITPEVEADARQALAALPAERRDPLTHASPGSTVSISPNPTGTLAPERFFWPENMSKGEFNTLSLQAQMSYWINPRVWNGSAWIPATQADIDHYIQQGGNPPSRSYVFEVQSDGSLKLIQAR